MQCVHAGTVRFAAAGGCDAPIYILVLPTVLYWYREDMVGLVVDA